jgi:hypothetical protein
MKRKSKKTPKNVKEPGSSCLGTWVLSQLMKQGHGVSLEVVKKIAGHRSPDVMLTYYKGKT